MIDLLVKFQTITCPTQKCGIVFAVSNHFYTEARADHRSFYYPNGHSQWFPQKSETEKLQAEKLRLEASLDFERNRRVAAQESAKQARAEEKRQRTLRLNQKKRIEAGVCVHCHRTFPDVQQHMHDKHGVVNGTESIDKRAKR